MNTLVQCYVIHIAFKMKGVELLKCLPGPTNMEENLREAVSMGNVDSVIHYIKAGVDVNSQNKVNGWTALHWAARRGHVSIVKELLTAGARTDILTKDGKTALHLSTNLEISKLLGDENTPDYSAQEMKKNNPSSFIPNYIKYPQFPYTKPSNDQGKEIEQTPTRPQSESREITQSTKSGFLFQPQIAFRTKQTEWAPCGLLVDPNFMILKVRTVDDSKLSDFIELRFQRKTDLSFADFTTRVASEFCLSSKSRCIKTVRKLPDTILRNTNDINRLTDYQQIEVLLSKIDDIGNCL